MTTVFNKSATTDFPLGTGCWGELYEDQLNSAITGKTATVLKNGDNVNITWDIGLTGPEIVTQTNITNNHTAVIPYQAGLLTDVTSVKDSYFCGYNSGGGQTIAGTWVDIIWDNHERIDSDYSNTLSTATITINTTGDYDIRVNVTTYITSGNNRSQSEARLVLNGVFMSGTKAYMYNREISEGGATGSIDIIKSFTAGDVLKVQCIRQAGSSVVKTYPEGCRVVIKKINN